MKANISGNYFYVFLVTIFLINFYQLIPTGRDTTENFNKMSAEKRGCRLKDKYSRTNCLIDSSVLYANETCKCMPWFMTPKDKCDLFGTKCFMEYFEKEKRSQRCRDSCFRTEYTRVLQYQKPISLMEDLGHAYGPNVSRSGPVI